MLPESLAEKYEILETLASSHFSTVYLALQKPLGRKVIVKVIAPHIAESETATKRFEREAKILANLDDPGVVKIYDYGQEKGEPFIISEFVEGENLTQVLEKRKTLEPKEALRIIKSVSEILSRIYKKGILHRDIKPSNIILKKDGQVKLTDFGLARSFNIERLTIEGEIIGTPAYMSPEQISGRPVDHRSDIFSLGVVAYELLTGENPFIADTLSGVLNKVLNYNPEGIKNLSPTVAHLLEKMLAKSPEKRFQSFEEVSMRIEELLDYPSRKKVKRGLNYKVVSAGILTLIFIGFLIFHWQGKEKGLPKTWTQILPDTLPMINDTKPKANFPTDTLRPKKAVKKIATTITLPTATDSGYLKIRAKPWADIYINSRYLGQTPLSQAIKLKAGAVKIRFSNQQFGILDTMINIIPKETTEISLDFRSHFSGLKVFAEPWAEIYIDGEYKGQTPIGTIYLPPGRYELKLLNPNFPPSVETLDFKMGEVKVKSIKW